MLLAGPGDEIEPEEATPAGDPDEAPVAGITPSLWTPSGEGAAIGGRTAKPALGAGLRGGGGWVGSLAATPDLLARVEHLPPVRDRAEIRLEEDAAPDHDFNLRHLLRPYRRQLLLGLLFVALDAGASVAGPILIQSGIDDGVARGSLDAVWLASAVFLAVTLADLAVGMAETFITGRTAERLLLALRVRIWAQLQRLSIDFYEREMGGRIMTRMTTDIDAFSTLLETGLINALVSLFTFAGVGVALFVWSWRLAAVTLAVIVPLAVATSMYRRRSARAYAEARERIAVVNANMQESLSGVREIQAYGREGRNERTFHRLAGRYLDARLTAQRLVSIYFPFIQLLSDAASAVVLGVGSVLIARGSLTSGELVGYLLFLDLFFSPIQQLSQTFDSYQQAGASRTQIADLMRRRTLTPLPYHPVRPGRLDGRIELADVHFAYPGAAPGQEALRGVDLVVRPGE
ncbi:MAG TPA: ABC transporter ATP-binding protein, partial [Acidimicrobiales bacterium]|nr:ABC transporter ATP-binding protein [Acidimicrobiales bacterium]